MREMSAFSFEGATLPTGREAVINCRKCRHYYVTWRKKFPHGCRAMGFMSLEIPSRLVKRASGTPCLLFERKKMRAKRKATSSPP